MSDGTPAADEVKKSRKGMLGALVALALVAGGTGAAYVAGIGPFAADEPVPVVEQPVKPAADNEELTPVSSPESTTLPPADAQETMYFEQVASNATITELVEDKFGSFDLSQIATTGDKADIRVKGTYRDGTTISGWMLLRQYDEAWYFAMITRDGNPTTTPVSGTPDAAVMKAIVDQQAVNQDIYKAILDGGYKVLTIDKVTAGSGTATIDITLTGGADGEGKGKITCISKDIAGVTHWFITGFAKS